MTEMRRTILGRSVRWDEARAQAAYAEGHWVDETLADALHRAARETPGRIVIIDGTHRIDAASLHARAAALARALLVRYPVGSVVSFMLPNWHEAATIYLGATLAGMIVHPVLPSLRDRDLGFMLRDVESRIIFIPPSFRGHDYGAMLTRVAAQMADPPDVAVVRGDAGPHLSFDALLAGESDAPLPHVDPDAVRMIMYTSGTTGRPKGVMHSHNSIHALIRQIGTRWQVDPGDSFLVVSPVSHIGGSIYAFECPLLLGSTAVLMAQWDADQAVTLARAERITHTAGATPFLEQLLAAMHRADTRLPDLKVFICGGASVPPSLIRRAAGAFGQAIVSRVYGSTEVPVTTVGVMDRLDITHAAETDGRPGIATVRLGEAGEILARGAQMLVGYVHAADEVGAFTDDGAYRTGDQGVLTDDGFLVVTGRIKDIIIRNGENIAPKEIEDMLMLHPDIADIAIVGLPDPRTGERACAVVVPRGDAAPDVASLADFLSAQGVARFKYPERVVCRETLPKNDAGKVLKHQLRAELSAPL